MANVLLVILDYSYTLENVNNNVPKDFLKIKLPKFVLLVLINVPIVLDLLLNNVRVALITIS
jgi:hypothetical protein